MQVKCKIGVKLVSSKVRPIGTGGRVSDRLPHIGRHVRGYFARPHSLVQPIQRSKYLKRSQATKLREGAEKMITFAMVYPSTPVEAVCQAEIGSLITQYR